MNDPWVVQFKCGVEFLIPSVCLGSCLVFLHFCGLSNSQPNSNKFLRLNASIRKPGVVLLTDCLVSIATNYLLFISEGFCIYCSYIVRVELKAQISLSLTINEDKKVGTSCVCHFSFRISWKLMNLISFKN